MRHGALVKRKKKDGRRNNGGLSRGLTEGHVLISGQRELLDAVEDAAERCGVSVREAWRRAARDWLDAQSRK